MQYGLVHASTFNMLSYDVSGTVKFQELTGRAWEMDLDQALKWAEEKIWHGIDHYP